MNRRSFITSSTAVVACAALPLTLTGCDNTTIANFVNEIATSASSLATYFGDASLAGQITSLASQIATDIANWQSGGTVNAVIAAINDLIGLVDLIPVAQPYAPLIVLILSALTGLLALIPQSKVSSSRAMTTKKYTIVPQHYAGYDKKHMTAAKNNFDAQWKTLSAGLPLTK